jgi:hypothetical protein
MFNFAGLASKQRLTIKEAKMTDVPTADGPPPEPPEPGVPSSGAPRPAPPPHNAGWAVVSLLFCWPPAVSA